MLKNNDVSGADPTERLVGIDHELIVSQCFNLVVLVLEVEAAVIILEGPEEG